MGFFPEPSHLAQFLAPMLVFVVAQMKRGVFKVVMVVATIMVMVLTISPIFIFGMAGFLLYYAILWILKKRRESSNKLTYAMLIRFSLYVAIVFIFTIFGGWSWLAEQIDFVRFYESVFEGARHGEDDGGRHEFLLNGLSILPRYFLGAGFGSVPTLMSRYFSRGSTFNAFLNVTLATGIFGLVAYVSVYVYPIYKLVIKPKNTYRLALGIAILCTFVTNGITGGIFRYSAFILLALASIEIVDSASNAEPLEVNNE